MVAGVASGGGDDELVAPDLVATAGDVGLGIGVDLEDPEFAGASIQSATVLAGGFEAWGEDFAVAGDDTVERRVGVRSLAVRVAESDGDRLLAACRRWRSPRTASPSSVWR
ncbi:MAG: hypothetical protein V9G12_07760 [Microthrixaceae bacterium]